MWILRDQLLRDNVGFIGSWEYCRNASHVLCVLKVCFQVLQGWVLGLVCILIWHADIARLGLRSYVNFNLACRYYNLQGWVLGPMCILIWHVGID
jgi:hypothetical protein